MIALARLGMAAEQPGPHRPARRAIFPSSVGAWWECIEVKSEFPEDEVLYAIVDLKTRESLPYTTAIKRLADLRGLEDRERNRFVSRLRAKYKRREAAGTLPTREPPPRELSEAIEAVFREDQERETEMRVRAEEAESRARALGLSLSGDLGAQIDAFRQEMHRHEEIVLASKAVAAHKLGLAPV